MLCLSINIPFLTFYVDRGSQKRDSCWRIGGYYCPISQLLPPHLLRRHILQVQWDGRAKGSNDLSRNVLNLNLVSKYMTYSVKLYSFMLNYYLLILSLYNRQVSTLWFKYFLNIHGK